MINLISRSYKKNISNWFPSLYDCMVTDLSNADQKDLIDLQKVNLVTKKF